MEISQLRKKEEGVGEVLDERVKQWRGEGQVWLLRATPFRDQEQMVSINMKGSMNIKVIFASSEI
jgi:hypothetical protein